jgi:outer membrane immunogenic protein
MCGGIAMRSITTLLASAIGLAFMSQAALAAGIPVKAAAPPPPPPFSWTGCYVGAHGGYKSGEVNEDFINGLPFSSYDAVDGASLGANVGCNFQSGIWVFGIVGDWTWTSLEGNGFAPNPIFVLSAEENWFGTVRGKVGFAINRWWGYVTGGWAWSEWKMQEWITGAPGTRIEDTQTIDGWVLGVGMDYAFTNNWIFNAEFLYTDYGTNTWYNPPDVNTCPGCTVPRDIEHNNFFVKVGFAYKFGGPFY